MENQTYKVDRSVAVKVLKLSGVCCSRFDTIWFGILAYIVQTGRTGKRDGSRTQRLRSVIEGCDTPRPYRLPKRKKNT